MDSADLRRSGSLVPPYLVGVEEQEEQYRWGQKGVSRIRLSVPLALYQPWSLQITLFYMRNYHPPVHPSSSHLIF